MRLNREQWDLSRDTGVNPTVALAADANYRHQLRYAHLYNDDGSAAIVVIAVGGVDYVQVSVGATNEGGFNCGEDGFIQSDFNEAVTVTTTGGSTAALLCVVHRKVK
jgi:hypothetical protein